MIASLLGEIAYKDGSSIIINVNGVGYEVSMPASDLANLQIKQEICIFTHLISKEDSTLLYGFLNIDTRNSFRKLIKVSSLVYHQL